MIRQFLTQWGFVLLLFPLCVQAEISIKDLSRPVNWRENQLVGYGVVTGLAGTGDSSRNNTLRQSLSNVFKQFDLSIEPDQIQSRNVAIVMITATLPPFAQTGDKVDVVVTSAGDARSLAGGLLLQTPLKGADGKVYVLAQGPLSVGGYRYDARGNMEQKNHPTVGVIPNGGYVERDIDLPLQSMPTSVTFALHTPDYTTASRMSEQVNQQFRQEIAFPIDAGRIQIQVPPTERHFVDFMRRVENIRVTPGHRAVVVINERTGTVVSGGDIRLTKVTIAHGDLKISISTDSIYGRDAYYGHRGVYVSGYAAHNTDLDVKESPAISIDAQTTVSDLVHALNRLNLGTKDIIAILQSVKAANALHADLIIQ